MRGRWRLCDYRSEVEHLAAFVVEIQVHLWALCEAAQKCRLRARTAGIVQRPGRRLCRQHAKALHHAPDRRDADAARDQDRMRGVLSQSEVVAWTRNGYELSDAQLLVHEARAAAAVRIALHRHGVAVRRRAG